MDCPKQSFKKIFYPQLSIHQYTNLPTPQNQLCSQQTIFSLALLTPVKTECKIFFPWLFKLFFSLVFYFLFIKQPFWQILPIFLLQAKCRCWIWSQPVLFIITLFRVHSLIMFHNLRRYFTPSLPCVTTLYPTSDVLGWIS